MVVIIDTSSPAGSQVYSLWKTAQAQSPLSTDWNQTWRQIFTTIALNSSNIAGVANPFTDPSGYFVAGMLRLAGLAFFGNTTLLYDSVYNNPSKYIMRDTETDLVPLAQTGQLTFVLSSYLSNGIAQTAGAKLGLYHIAKLHQLGEPLLTLTTITKATSTTPSREPLNRTPLTQSRTH